MFKDHGTCKPTWTDSLFVCTTDGRRYDGKRRQCQPCRPVNFVDLSTLPTRLTCRPVNPIDLSTLSTCQPRRHALSTCQPCRPVNPVNLVNLVDMSTVSTCQPCRPVNFVNLSTSSTCQPCRPVNHIDRSTLSTSTLSFFQSCQLIVTLTYKNIVNF